MIGNFERSQTKRIYQEYVALFSLIPLDEPSARSDLAAMYAKILAVSSGSEFEDWVSTILIRAVEGRVKDRAFATAVSKMTIERRYFQFFDFESSNFNKIWRFVPPADTVDIRDIVRNEKDLPESIDSFMQLNRERNRLVHQNFAAASPEFTAEEVIEKFHKACRCVVWIEEMTRWEADSE